MKKWIDLAIQNGVCRHNYKNRVDNLGWSPERAATTPLRKGLNKKWINIANKNRIKYSTFRDRVNKLGWTEEKAATIPMKQPRNDRKWIELAKKNGISRNTYIDRVDERFWTPEDAATIKPMKVKEKSEIANKAKAEYAGVTHDRIFNDENNHFSIVPQHLKIAEENGISESAVKSRVYELGWTIQEAITTPVIKIDFERPEGYYEYLQVAKDNGIKNSTYYHRVKEGMTPKDAASKELAKPTDLIRHDEKWMRIAVQNGIKPHTYRSRVNNGWTTEEAATTRILKSGEFLNEERRERVLKGFRMFRGIKEGDSS